MRGIGSLGAVATAVALVLGMWEFIAPFVIGYQTLGQKWIVATRNDLWVGAGLVGISLAILALYAACALRDAVEAARRRQQLQQEEPAQQ